MEQTKCSKCGGKMEEGYPLGLMIETQQLWMTKTKFMTLKFSPAPKKIAGFRCTSCGYLESYAK